VSGEGHLPCDGRGGLTVGHGRGIAAPTLDQLIERARLHVMTPEEKFEQRVSFVYGQLADSANPPTKDEVRKRLIEMHGHPEAAPIPMILHCPECHLQHIDEPDERTPDWDNPPHRSHLCHGCGCIWRPADQPTEGVLSIQSRGHSDSWPPIEGSSHGPD
jgi:hypothetical protein